jgi:hypothetical protein
LGILVPGDEDETNRLVFLWLKSESIQIRMVPPV